MKITINGKSETIQPCSVGELVRRKGLNSAALVVELNHQIVKQETWDTTQLNENDMLELLSFVGGG